MYSPELKSLTNAKYEMNEKKNLNLELITSMKNGIEDHSQKQLNKYEDNTAIENSQIHCKTTIQNSMYDDPTDTAYDELSLFN